MCICLGCRWPKWSWHDKVDLINICFSPGSLPVTSSTQCPIRSARSNTDRVCELSLSPQPPKYLLLVFSHAYLDAVAQWGPGGLLVPYLRAFWSLWMQSAAKGWCFRDCRNLWTWGRRMLLGGKRPVHNHNSSQPFSSLYLHEERSRRKKNYSWHGHFRFALPNTG